MADSAPKASRDYYQLGEMDISGESWLRWLPMMRVYGLVVLAITLAVASPWNDPGGLAGAAAMAIMAVLLGAFLLMWVHRPIWQHSTRLLAVHGALQVAAYAALVTISPAFGLLAVLIYPQVLFSLPVRWSIAGGFAIGLVSALAFLSAAHGQLASAADGVLVSLFVATLATGLAVWIRETITQSLDRRVLIEQLETTRAELSAAERAAGVAEERTRLAREIHDTLAQGFASIATHLEAADASLAAGRAGDSGQAREDVRTALDVCRSGLAEARTLVWALRPDALAIAGLGAAIRRIAASAAGSGEPVVDVEVSGPVRQLHPDVEVTLLRAAQEALANVRRHAGASTVTVTLTYFADQVSLDVTDDGRGFDPTLGRRSGGMGLAGMRERAERLGGSLAIESEPGAGTAVAVTLPAIEVGAPVAVTLPAVEVGAPADVEAPK